MGHLASSFRLVAISAAIWLAAAWTFAAGRPESRMQFRIPEGDARRTLQAFSEQSKVEFIFSNERVTGIRTRRINGWYLPSDALDRMLEGTALRRVLDAATGALTVDLAGPPPAVAESAAAASVDMPPPGSEVSPEPESGDRFLNENPISLLEFVVTGSSIRGQEAPVGSQLLNLPRDDIVAVGAQTTRDLISTVPQFSQFNVAPSPAIQNTEAPNLRNLGTGATLTLLNGHRLVGAGVGGTSADPSTIPLAAIQRIQVVPDGSSAIYGSDAVAGVINISTRTDLEGSEGIARFAFGEGYRQQSYSAVHGQMRRWGNLLLAFERSGNTNLEGARRGYVTNDLRAAGGADTRTTNTSVPNLVVDGVSYAYPDLRPNTVNTRDTAKDADIVPRNDRTSFLASIRSSLGDRVEFFADVTYSDSSASNAQPINTFNAFSFTMTDANPFFVAPPGTDARSVVVNYSFGDTYGHAPPLRWQAMAATATVGVTVDLGNAWSADIIASHGWGDSELSQTILDTSTATAAVGGTTVDTAFDPFGGRTNPAILKRIADTVYIDRVDQRLSEFVAKADGPVAAWRSGIVRSAFGIQGRQESFSPTPIKGPIGSVVPVQRTARREVAAGFAELLLPIAGGERRYPLVRRLDVSLAARLERYDSFGYTTNPKVGFTWQPTESVLIRGSYGTSFRAPSLAAIEPVSTAVQVRPNFYAPGALTPPGMGAMNSLNIIGGNPNLGPEEATTRSIGFEAVPKGVGGLRFGLTAYAVSYSNVVANPQNRFANPNLADTYIINPTEGQINEWTRGIVFAGTRFGPGETGIITDSRPRNLRTVKVDGLDYELSKRWRLPRGDFHATVAGTTYLRYRATSAPGARSIDQLNQGAVRTKARVGLSWKSGRFAAGVAANVTGGYKNPAATPVQSVGSFVTVDANVAWEIGREGWFKDLHFTVGLSNAFDEAPPLFLSGNGFNGNLASPIGRLVSISIKRPF